MSVRSNLRSQAMEIHSGCWWPNCDIPLWVAEGTLEMAHVMGRGMGHQGDRDRIDNVVMLCRYHHRHLDEGTPIVMQDREAAVLIAINGGWEGEFDEYVTFGVSRKWQRREWVDAIRRWRWSNAAVSYAESSSAIGNQ